jgi:hypothetical protein
MVRLKNVETGQHVLLSGIEFIVRRTQTEIVLKRVSGGSFNKNPISEMKYGLKCQMYVNLHTPKVIEKGKPIGQKISEIFKEDWHTVAEVAKKIGVSVPEIASRMYGLKQKYTVVSIPHFQRSKKYKIEQ